MLRTGGKSTTHGFNTANACSNAEACKGRRETTNRPHDELSSRSPPSGDGAYDAGILEIPGPAYIGWQCMHFSIDCCPGRCRTPEDHYAYWRHEYDYHLRNLYALTQRHRYKSRGDIEKFARFVYKYSSKKCLGSD